MLPNMHSKGRGLRGRSVPEETTWKSSLPGKGRELDTLSHVRGFFLYVEGSGGGGTEVVSGLRMSWCSHHVDKAMSLRSDSQRCV